MHIFDISMSVHRDIAAGDYLIYALHIKIKGADGAPARVVLMKE